MYICLDIIIKLEIIEFLLNAIDSEYTIISDVAERDATHLIRIDFEFRKSCSCTNIIIMSPLRTKGNILF